jgi:N-acylneuraminate cytidylyltransferase
VSKAIALIPARGGSKRILKKNTRLLAGHPLIAYSIASALRSGCFEKVLVSSDDRETLEISRHYGADVLVRPEEYATDTSPDIEWVRHALQAKGADNYQTFSILRPTSPFRKADTIIRAFDEWRSHSQVDSLRAVEPVAQHPGKMWLVKRGYMQPLLLQPKHPFHDSQYADLPAVHVQNASLEIAHTATVWTTGSISGERIVPFRTFDDEGFDLNSEYDWLVAEAMIERGDAILPEIEVPAYV